MLPAVSRANRRNEQSGMLEVVVGPVVEVVVGPAIEVVVEPVAVVVVELASDEYCSTVPLPPTAKTLLPDVPQTLLSGCVVGLSREDHKEPL